MRGSVATYEGGGLKGHLDGLLLAALEAGPKHGYAVRETLRDATGGAFDLPTGTIYPALHRLERAGLISGEWTTSDGGRRRRTYQLTARGHQTLERRTRRVDHVRGRRLRRPRCPTVAPHDLISAQLRTLASRLPPAVYAEVADGLQETYETKLTQHTNPCAAAQAAITEFGDADTITRAMCRGAPWRRQATALLVTGPLIGGIWAATLIGQQAWQWPLPPVIRWLYGAVLILTVALLARSRTEHHAYRRGQRRVTIAGATLIGLDLLACAAALNYATISGWAAAAALASCVRILMVGLISVRRIQDTIRCI